MFMDTLQLYKFHRINKFLYQLLIDNQLWFSKPYDFNDPFDTQFISDLKSTDKLKTEAVETLVKQMHTDDFRFNKEVVKQVLLKRANEIDLDKTMNEHLFKEFQNWGICCFSEVFDNLLMWSHYTDGHRGICLEFDFTSDQLINGWLCKINYSEDFPHIKENSEYIKGITTKSIYWKYEQEFRLITPKSGLHSFAKDSLTGIIFGSKTDETEIVRLMELTKTLGYTKAVFKQASINSSKYKLDYTNL